MASRSAAGGLLIAVLTLTASLHGQAPSSGPPPDPSDTYTHAIVRGDTLIGVAQRLLVEWRDWRKVARLNRVRQPRRLVPGRSLIIPVALMRRLPGEARVLWVRGQPRAAREGQAPVVALLGAVLPVGTTITTGSAESLRLQLSTGSDVTIGEQASLTLVELHTLAGGTVRRTVLDATRGRIETTVAPSTHPAQRHHVRTPVVTATVRGTDFRVAVDDAGVATEVTEGTVRVARDNEAIPLDAGFGVRARPGVALTAPARLLPPPELDQQPPPVERLPVRIRWPAVEGAARYRVRLLPPADGPLLAEQLVSTPETAWPDLADGAYRLAVRAVDADGLEGADATARFAVDARPLPPLAQGAADGRPVYGDALTLQWTQPAGVDGFDVQIARDGHFDQLAAERSRVGALTVSVPLPPGRYAWRIASRAGEDRGPWSDPLAVELRARPASGPPPEALVAPRTLTLRWSAGLVGERYGVQVAADPGFTTPLVDTIVTEPTLTMDRPPRGRYHVRVRLVNADGIEGPYGPTQTLDIPRPPRSKWWWLLVPASAAGILLAAL